MSVKATERSILAMVVPKHVDLVDGGVPTFRVDDPDAREKLAMEVGRLLRADVYRLGNDAWIVVPTVRS